MEIIPGLINRIQVLETEKQEAVTPYIEEQLKTEATQLPKNCSVSRVVLMELAARVSE